MLGSGTYGIQINITCILYLYRRELETPETPVKSEPVKPKLNKCVSDMYINVLACVCQIIINMCVCEGLA